MICCISGAPDIQQIIVAGNDSLHENEFEKKLYIARLQVEKILNDPELYICSLSSKVISYKGLIVSENIQKFYPDLTHKDMKTSLCVFHQRFSTNTAPSWNLAQPFRAIAHNGEINTYRGNKNWMKVHEQEMNSPLFDDVENLKPVIQQGASDSAALDNVFELLNISGQPAPLAKLMLVPDAWSKKNKTLPKDHQQLLIF